MRGILKNFDSSMPSLQLRCSGYTAIILLSTEANASFILGEVMNYSPVIIGHFLHLDVARIGRCHIHMKGQDWILGDF